MDLNEVDELANELRKSLGMSVVDLKLEAEKLARGTMTLMCVKEHGKPFNKNIATFMGVEEHGQPYNKIYGRK